MLFLNPDNPLGGDAFVGAALAAIDRTGDGVAIAAKAAPTKTPVILMTGDFSNELFGLKTYPLIQLLWFDTSSRTGVLCAELRTSGNSLQIP